MCNGMRLAVQKLMSNIIEAAGPFNDEDALIRRIPMIPTDIFELQETKLPVRRLNTSNERILIQRPGDTRQLH
ncbi:hypothetical protein TNCV_4919221 [Trichonephila clavipes]|nr:hypothetical protein TNCV_4919221 [Trichonephila clavipes]